MKKNTVNDEKMTQPLPLIIPKTQRIADTEDDNASNFETLPSSPVTHLVNQTINAFSAGRPIKANRNTDIRYIEKTPDVWSITSENKTSKITLSIDNIGLLKTNNKGLKKCFAFVLIQCNDQHYASEIGFSLQELIDNGMYSSIRSARRGITENIKKIMSMTFEGNSKKGRKIIQQDAGKLIYHMSIKNNYVTLYLNEKINVEFIAQYFTLLPKFAFALNNNAFSLLEYIFFLARQNTRSIKEKGYFNISLRAVRDYMNLPNEADTPNHSQLIRNPIETAIEQIEDANNNSSFTITPVYKDDAKNIKEWLDGYLKVGLADDFAEMFIKIANDTEKSVEASRKRKEKALAMVEAKKIENSQKEKSD